MVMVDKLTLYSLSITLGFVISHIDFIDIASIPRV